MRQHSLRHLWPCLILSALLVATARPVVEAGSIITVNYSGSGGLTGEFSYLQSHRNVAGSPGVYDFKGSNDAHDVTYNGASWPKSLCDVFTITTNTNGNQTFYLVATNKTTGAKIEIWITKSTPFSQLALPVCTAFPATPDPSSKVTMTPSSGSPTTTPITSITSCMTTLWSVVEPVYCSTIPMVTSPQSTCYQTYACQPRRTCCLAGLFARRAAACCYR